MIKIDQIRDFFSKLKGFFAIDIWRIEDEKLSSLHSFGLKYLRVFVITIREFFREKMHLRASALTFYSLLSVVPVFAMAFGIAKGFGFEKILEREIKTQLLNVVSPEVVNRIISSANNLLMSTKGGMIAGLGLVALFWTIIRVIGNIELAFNEIWRIEKQRPFSRKFSDYLSAMLICPVLLIISSSATVFIKTQLNIVSAKFQLISYFKPLILFSLKFFSLFVIWGLFTFLYIFLPNTKVNFSSGLFAGVIAGTFYQITQWAYITFQIGVARYNAIYGSFAALPLFLMWLQISWIIVLVGAELSYAYQNIDLFELEPDVKKITPYGFAILAIAVMREITKSFCDGRGALTEMEICKILQIPKSMGDKIIKLLLRSGLIIEVNKGNEDSQETGFYPSIDPHELTLFKIISKIMGIVENIPLGNKERLKNISSSIKEITNSIQTLSNRPITEI